MVTGVIIQVIASVLVSDWWVITVWLVEWFIS